MTNYLSDSFSSIFIRILPEYFPIPLSHLKRSFHSKNQNLLNKSLSSILSVHGCRPSIFWSNTPFWRSNTALDGPLINQSNCLFSSGYTIRSRFGPRKYNSTAKYLEALRNICCTENFRPHVSIKSLTVY